MTTEEGVIGRLGMSLPAGVCDIIERWPAAVRVVSTAAVLAAFVGLEFVVLRGTRLPAEAYFEPMLMAGLAKRVGWLFMAGAVLLFVLLSRYGALLRPWRAFENGSALRAFIVFLAFVIAWPLTTYGYNYYLDQAHLFDRIALAALVVLLWWRPFFIYPFVILAFVVLWQIEQPPLGGSVLAHKLQVLHVLNLFAAFFAVRCIIGGTRSGEFVFLTCCLIASSYWLAAFGKTQIGWLQNANLHLITPAAYAHGWLASLNAEPIIAFANMLQTIELPMALFAIGFEALFLLFLICRRASFALLLAATIFHVGVFAIYGFFFWTWILVDVALFLLLLRVAGNDPWIYSRSQFVLSIVLIALGAYWADPPKLGWHDTRLTYTTRIDVVDASGNTRPLRPAVFGLYDDVMTMAAFPYLVDDHARLVGSYGVTRDGPLARAINSASTGAEILELEAALTSRRFDQERANRFFGFVTRYVSNQVHSGERLAVLDVLAAPPQFWGYRGEPSLELKDIRFVVVSEITTFFDGETISVIRETELNRSAISEASQ